MENYGLALKELRLHFKYTQREIADKVGVSNHAVSKWENGINQPDISTLRLICDIYGVTTEQFFRIASGESVEEVLTQAQELTIQPDLQGVGTDSTSKPPHPKRWWIWLVCGVLLVSSLVGIALALGDGESSEQSNEQSSSQSQGVESSLDSEESVSSEASENEAAESETSEEEENNYAVQFVKQDGTLLFEGRYNFGEEWTISDSIVTGYTFDFWLCNGEKYDVGDTFCATEGEEYLFVAYYTPNQFCISYMLPIHTYFYEKEVFYQYDGENYLCAGIFAEEGDGYYVDGWIIDGVEYAANALIGNLSSENGADFEAAPIWKKGEVKYTSFTFDCGYAEGGFTYVCSVRKGERVTMPICEWEREGYTFKGWKNEKTGEVYLVGEAFTLPSIEEVLFTALWEQNE